MTKFRGQNIGMTISLQETHQVKIVYVMHRAKDAKRARENGIVWRNFWSIVGHTLRRIKSKKVPMLFCSGQCHPCARGVATFWKNFKKIVEAERRGTSQVHG